MGHTLARIREVGDRMHYRFWEGQDIFLSPMEKDEYVASMMRWVHDDEATHYMLTGLVPTTPQALAEEYDQLTRSRNDFFFGIVEKSSDTYVGNVGLYGINWYFRHGEMRRFIGEESGRGKGYGTQAARLIVAFAFERLNLNKVWAGVSVENEGSAKSELKAGFTREGVLRQEIYRNGRYYDAFRVSILKAEYLALKEKGGY